MPNPVPYKESKTRAQDTVSMSLKEQQLANSSTADPGFKVASQPAPMLETGAMG